MELWVKYIREVCGSEVITYEQGFVQFKEMVMADKTRCLLIEAFYVDPEYRGQDLGRQMLSDLQDVAKAKSISMIKSTYHFAHPNSSNVLAMALKYGFKICGGDAHLVIAQLEVQ